MVALPAALVLTTLFKLVVIARYAPEHAGLIIQAFRNIGGMFNEFAVGMTVAAIWAKLEYRGVELRRGVGLACTVVGGVGMWLPLYVGQHVVGREAYVHGTGPLGWIPALAMFPSVAFFAGLALFGICYQANTVTRFLSLRPIAWLGTVSYGIYLWHLPLGQWLARGFTPDIPPLERMVVLLTVGTALTLIWSAFSYRFVEQPFLQRKKPTAPAAAPAVAPAPAPAIDVADDDRPTIAVLPGPRSRPMAVPVPAHRVAVPQRAAGA
jgi:peptidoglycan/LPS O-acetylase OafA/YrhL